jgi:hypothetical protein
MQKFISGKGKLNNNDIEKSKYLDESSFLL